MPYNIANERLTGVFGRVLSFDDSHAGDLILSLGFVIFNASTGAIRVVNVSSRLRILKGWNLCTDQHRWYRR